MISRRSILKAIAGLFGVAVSPKVAQAKRVRVVHAARSRYETSLYGFAYDVTPASERPIYVYVVRDCLNLEILGCLLNGRWNDSPFNGNAPATLLLMNIHGRRTDGVTHLRYTFSPCVPFDTAANPGVKVISLYGSADFSKLEITRKEWEARTHEDRPPIVVL